MSNVGLLTVESHRAAAAEGRHYHVFFNGEDVTRRCLEADDAAGRVVLYKLRNGHRYIDGIDSVATETLTGDVQILEGEPFY